MEAKALTGKSYSRRRPETTLLYQTVADHLETFIAQRESDGKGLPPHVIEEFRAYLRCGQLHYGFMRVACSCCKYEGAVAYSCKKRGFCPSCAGKRMAESEQHLIENILPHVGYRQYVLSLPIPLRYWAATNKDLTSKVHAIFKNALMAFFIKKAKDQGITDPLPGGITFIQRAGSALALNVHFHTLCLEGVYQPPANRHGKPTFHSISPPSDEECGEIVEGVASKVIKLLRKRGYLKEEAEEIEPPPLDASFQEHPSYRDAVAASVSGRIAFGPHAGEKVRKIGSGLGPIATRRDGCPVSATRESRL